METSKFNWEIVEEIAKTVFPDKYEMATQKQVKEIEKCISAGQSPFVQRQEIGGMPMDFGAAITEVANIMTIINIIVTWYNYTHPQKHEQNCKNCLDSITKDSKLNTLFADSLNKKTTNLIMKHFDKILKALHKIIKTLNNQ